MDLQPYSKHLRNRMIVLNLIRLSQREKMTIPVTQVAGDVNKTVEIKLSKIL